MLELQTFGGLELRTGNGERVEALAGRTKCLALLAYLAVEAPEGRVPREKVTALLWAGRSEDRARGSLRMALTHIRKATESTLLSGEGESTVGLVRDHLQADVTTLREALDAGEERRALELYEGEFLAGVRMEGAGPFQRWADRKRGHYRQQAYEAALSVGASARNAGDLASAEAAFRQALDLAPLREEAAAKLIRTLAQRGRPADALQLYDAFRQRREAELEMAPSDELQQMVEDLKRVPPPASGAGAEKPAVEDASSDPVAASAEELEGGSTPPSDGPSGREPSRWGRFRRRTLLGALVAVGLLGGILAGAWHLLDGDDGAAAAAGDRSVAVLPFEAIGTEDPDPIAEGLHSDLLTRLSTDGDLEVISATSVKGFRETDLPLPAIADSLGVTWVLEGHVQRAGDGIEVHAQLVDPRTDTHTWADTYRRELTAGNLFDIQSDITQRIAGVLETRLAGGEENRLDRRATQSLDAHRFYVRGRSLLEQRRVPEMRRALEYFEQALAEDSSYALAWAGRADGLTLLGDRREADPDTLVPEAAAAARRSLELAPDLAEAHAAIGRVHVYRREGPAALRELKRAVELRPSYAAANAWLAKLQLILGRPDKALPCIERAIELHPLSPENRQFLVWTHLANENSQLALNAARRMTEFHSDLVPRRGPEMFALFHLGWADTLRSRARAEGDSAVERPLVALAVAKVGDPGPARHLLEKVEAGEAPFTTALLHAVLGHEARAFDALERAVQPESGLWDVSVIFARYLFPEVLGPLREKPRFERIMRDVNRSWGLNPDGSLPDSVDDSFDPRADD